MRTNARARNDRRTHEGAMAHPIKAEQELRRSVMACLLWEGQFYESGEAIADRIAALVPKVEPAEILLMVREARGRMHLRHVPLLLARETARMGGKLAAASIYEAIQRPDELAEFLSLYWKDGKCPLSAQVKKGLAAAFAKFDEYQLAKYDRPTEIKLRDVLFLCHAKPKDAEQDALWKRLIAGELAVPDTWETRLSGEGTDKKAKWEDLLTRKRLGGLALIRNLRNMTEAKVGDGLIRRALAEMKTDRILPFRFIAAANCAPRFEPELEQAMFGCLAEAPKLPGKTILLIDVSGSMVGATISERSELDRLDAASGLAMLAREICEDVRVYAFSCPVRGSGPAPKGAAVATVTVQNIWGQPVPYMGYCVELPARRGFALRDKLRELPHDGTPLGWAVEYCTTRETPFDRLIVLTDEQSQDAVGSPHTPNGYMINVASAKNGVGYGAWTHIDGWSEAVLDYIRASESATDLEQRNGVRDDAETRL